MNSSFFILRTLNGKKYPQAKLQRLQQGMNMDIWIVGISNHFFMRGS